jgi:hypothetical protein
LSSSHTFSSELSKLGAPLLSSTPIRVLAKIIDGVEDSPKIYVSLQLFGTDPDQNRALEETPRS